MRKPVMPYANNKSADHPVHPHDLICAFIIHCLDCISHVMRKPVFAICEQQRHRSACASAQSDQCLYYSLPR